MSDGEVKNMARTFRSQSHRANLLHLALAVLAMLFIAAIVALL
ncbi:hypothetical protein N182_33780 [Sinorhizobium sp. GL2]|nr:hypothetical protein N182_33780 [Sinorhizobium sp. GL2]